MIATLRAEEQDDIQHREKCKWAENSMADLAHEIQKPGDAVQRMGDPEYTVDKDKAPTLSYEGTRTDGGTSGGKAYGGRKSETGGTVAIFTMLNEDLEKEITRGKLNDAEAKKQHEEQKGSLKKLLDAQTETYLFLRVFIISRADLVNQEVVTMVTKRGQAHHSSAIAQLASRVAAVAKYDGGNGKDVFGKIKGIIGDMIAKLVAEADSDSGATEKAYYNEQMAKTEAKKSGLDDAIAKMTEKVDQATAKSAELKEQIAVLKDQLTSLVKERAVVRLQLWDNLAPF
jgi:hypothetical protein